MNTLGLALRDALEARQRHALYNDGARFIDLTRAAAISHILHATFTPDPRS